MNLDEKLIELADAFTNKAFAEIQKIETQTGVSMHGEEQICLILTDAFKNGWQTCLAALREQSTEVEMFYATKLIGTKADHYMMVSHTRDDFNFIEKIKFDDNPVFVVVHYEGHLAALSKIAELEKENELLKNIK